MVPDCNAHGVADSCDIANGMRDKNAEGHPDECSYAYGDFDLDGMIGAAGLAPQASRRGSVAGRCALSCASWIAQISRVDPYQIKVLFLFAKSAGAPYAAVVAAAFARRAPRIDMNPSTPMVLITLQRTSTSAP